jgi:hypothetical protein
MPTEFSNGKLLVVALVLVILAGAGISYAYEVARVDPPSLTLNGTYNIRPDSYIEKTFNVSVSGHYFNIKTVNGTKSTYDFALMVLPNSYAGKFINALTGNYTLTFVSSYFMKLRTNSTEAMGLLPVKPGELVGSTTFYPPEYIEAGQYCVFLINLSGQSNSVSMDIVITY